MSSAGSPEHRKMVVENLVALAESFRASMEGAREVYPDIDQDVWRVLQDQALARRPDFQESLHQMLAGLGQHARTRRESAGDGPDPG